MADDPSGFREIGPVDITVRLRAIGLHRHVGWDLIDGLEVEREQFEPNQTCLEAAQEIERLRGLPLASAMRKMLAQASDGSLYLHVYPDSICVDGWVEGLSADEVAAIRQSVGGDYERR